MSVWRLIFREIGYRKLGFLLAVVSVAAAVGCFVAVETLLANYDLATGRIVESRRQQTEVSMSKLQEDFRKLTLKMGFTTILLHKDQDLAELHALGYATHYMPEEYADRLPKNQVMTLNHVLPTLQQRVAWPEQNGASVLLIGVKGEVYVQSALQMPLLEKVPEHSMVIGKELARSLKLAKGQQVKFMGEDFDITGIRPGNGGREDIGVWIPLADAQRLLGRPGQINQIMAVECMCPGDRVAVIFKEISRIIPDIQVAEYGDVASARSESRKRVNEAARRAADGELKHRDALRDGRRSLVRILVPAVTAATVVWIGFLLFGNVRDRRGEIGILRAIGVGRGSIQGLFLGKALIIGLAGAVIGCIGGVCIGNYWERDPAAIPLREAMLHASWLLWVIPAAAVLALLASAIPAALAARQDPADMLRDE